MGSIPINDYSDAFRIFYYDVDGYISGNSFYILPNPFDEDDEYDFLISGSDTSYVFATLNNNNSIVPQLTITINVFNTSGTYI